MASKKLTPTQRRKRFNAIFNSLPGRDGYGGEIDRINKITAALYCSENVVRRWRLPADRKSASVIPASKLAILEREISR